jgi:hypothetical protein
LVLSELLEAEVFDFEPLNTGIEAHPASKESAIKNVNPM